MSNVDQIARGRALRFKVASGHAGGISAALMSSDALARATNRVQALGSTALDDIWERICRLETPDRRSIEALFADAHDIRAIAATFGFTGLGSAADSLCRYLDSFDCSELPSRMLVDVIVAAMRASFASPTSPLTEEIAMSCRQAVEATLARRAVRLHRPA
jgi:chemotaxis protein histidine kinase CheA